MKQKARLWLHNLIAAIITGGATAGLSSVGLTVADAAGVNAGQLNIKQALVLTGAGAFVGLMAYLKQSPLPPEDTDQDPS